MNKKLFSSFYDITPPNLDSIFRYILQLSVLKIQRSRERISQPN